MTATPGSAAPMDSAERRRVPRFSRTERLIHWVHACAFFGMLVTGVVLYLPALVGTFGSREAVRAAHVYIAAGWLVALLLIAAVADRGALRGTARDLDLFDSDDRDWLRGRRRPQGRFNAGQKVHAAVQAAFAALFLVSGVLLLAGERNTDLRFDSTILLHDGLTLGATLLVLGHLYLALAHRTTRPALRGMVLGTVDARWSARQHSKWAPAAGGAAPTQLRARLRRPATWLLLLAAAAGAAAAIALVSPSPSAPGSTPAGAGGP